jgi:transketolase
MATPDTLAGLPPGKPNLEIFAQTLIELAERDRDLIVVTSDSRGSGRLTGFGERFPDQIVEIGIAEQNLVGVAAGLAAAGKKVFAVSPACFLTARAFEQIKTDVAYSNQPVRLVGISAGVSYGALGTTHHSLHDLAALQAIHNLDVLVPADNFETRQAVLAAYAHPRPVYLRFGKQAMPAWHRPDAHFAIGQAIQLTAERAAYDFTWIACGETVTPAFLAQQLLQEQGLTSCVLSLPWLRPLDESAILQAARRSRVVITVEEHSVNGGLGSRVAGLLMQAGLFRPFRMVGFPDEHTYTGSQAEIFAHYGISAQGLAQTALERLTPAAKESA